MSGLYPCIIGCFSEQPAEQITIIDGIPTIISQTFANLNLYTEPFIVSARGLTYPSAVSILQMVTSVLDSHDNFTPVGVSYRYQNVVVSLPQTYLGRDESKRFIVEARYDTRRW